MPNGLSRAKRSPSRLTRTLAEAPKAHSRNMSSLGSRHTRPRSRTGTQNFALSRMNISQGSGFVESCSCSFKRQATSTYSAKIGSVRERAKFRRANASRHRSRFSPPKYARHHHTGVQHDRHRFCRRTASMARLTFRTASFGSRVDGPPAARMTACSSFSVGGRIGER